MRLRVVRRGVIVIAVRLIVSDVEDEAFKEFPKKHGLTK